MAPKRVQRGATWLVTEPARIGTLVVVVLIIAGIIIRLRRRREVEREG